MPEPIFTRRHYCAVADVIRDADYLEPETRGRLVSDFSAMFKADNGRFDHERFRAASEPEPVRFRVATALGEVLHETSEYDCACVVASFQAEEHCRFVDVIDSAGRQLAIFRPSVAGDLR